MREFFLNLMSTSGAASTKNFLIILFGVTLAVICLYEVYMDEYILPTTTLAGLISILAELKRRERKVRIEQKKEKENGKAEN